MRIFLTVLVLIFSFQSWIKASDITDFEIEGISIGDSLLEHFSRELIEKEKAMMDQSSYTDKEYFNAWFEGYGKFETYDYLQIHLKSNDVNYIVKSVEGKIIYEHNIEECYKQKDIIYKELKNIFSSATVKHDKGSHSADLSGKSKTDTSYFFLPNNAGIIGVACYDWSKEFGKVDNLKVLIDTPEFLNWLQTKAYK